MGILVIEHCHIQTDSFLELISTTAKPSQMKRRQRIPRVMILNAQLIQVPGSNSQLTQVIFWFMKIHMYTLDFLWRIDCDGQLPDLGS